ncbi:hypothetical protein [Microbacterium sp. NPDC079995]|uniref:arsenate reductase/protein-tyrosine-phosphatase family protein n=1 Tax=unclassified Microbacterium TaxID=2609290 RepID=UPI00344F8755
MTDGVLFICHANVCRSRLMEHEFRTAERASGAERWRASSAGVAAVAGQPVCDEVQGLVTATGEDELVSLSDHGAVLLDRDLLQDAGLVLTATRAERADVALLIPAMRSRTFTLREAVTLAQIEPATAAGRSEDASGLLAAFAGFLDQHRGSVRADNRTRSGWVRRRDRSHDVDIPDAHHRRLKDHHRVLQTVQEQTIALHTLLRAFADRSGRRAARGL